MLDLSTVQLTWKPNQYLVTPPGFGAAKAHRQSPVFPLPPAELARRFKAHALAEPRVSLLEESSDGLAMELVQRSAFFRFPDFISVRILPAAGGSTLAIYSRARYGVRDFGVNQRRIDGWLEALLK